MDFARVDDRDSGHGGYTRRGLHLRQQLDEGQRHGAAQCGGAGARDARGESRAIRLAVAADGLEVQDGTVIARDGRRVTYGELVAGQVLHVEAKPTSRFKDPKSYRLISKSVKRVDIPAKVTGGESYVHDLRLPGMQHARVIRPPSYGAVLESVDTREVEAMGGEGRPRCQLPRGGRAEGIHGRARRCGGCGTRRKWSEHATLPDMKALPATLLAMPSQDVVIEDKSGAGTAAKTLEATYTRHYMAHGSIGPSCAVAHMKDGALTVWSHTQGVFPHRDAIAEMLGMPKESVRVHPPGRRRAATATTAPTMPRGDAALIATKMPGVPVRVQWMREDEHRWEPYGVGDGRQGAREPRRQRTHRELGLRRVELHALDAAGRSGVAARGATRRPRVQARSRRRRPRRSMAWAIATRFRPTTFPSMHVVHHFLPDMPLRVSAMRAPRRLSQRLRARELHGRAGVRCRRRSRGVSLAASRRPARRGRWSSASRRASIGRRRIPRPAAARASPSRATRITPRTARLPSRSRSIRRRARSGSCARSPPSIADKS